MAQALAQNEMKQHQTNKTEAADIAHLVGLQRLFGEMLGLGLLMPGAKGADLEPQTEAAFDNMPV